SGDVTGFLGFVPMSGLLGHGHPSQLRVPRNRVRFKRIHSIVTTAGRGKRREQSVHALWSRTAGTSANPASSSAERAAISVSGWTLAGLTAALAGAALARDRRELGSPSPRTQSASKSFSFE